MSTLLKVVSLIVCCLIVNTSGKVSDVALVTEDGFDLTVAVHDWLLLFCRMSDGSCKRFSTLFERVAKELKKMENTRAGLVDVDKYPDLAFRFKYGLNLNHPYPLSDDDRLTLPAFIAIPHETMQFWKYPMYPYGDIPTMKQLVDFATTDFLSTEQLWEQRTKVMAKPMWSLRLRFFILELNENIGTIPRFHMQVFMFIGSIIGILLGNMVGYRLRKSELRMYAKMAAERKVLAAKREAERRVAAEEAASAKAADVTQDGETEEKALPKRVADDDSDCAPAEAGELDDGEGERSIPIVDNATSSGVRQRVRKSKKSIKD